MVGAGSFIRFGCVSSIVNMCLQANPSFNFVLACTTPLSFVTVHALQLLLFLSEFDFPKRTFLFFDGIEYNTSRCGKIRDYDSHPILYSVQEVKQRLIDGFIGDVGVATLPLFRCLAGGFDDRQNNTNSTARNIRIHPYVYEGPRNERSLVKKLDLLEYKPKSASYVDFSSLIDL